MFRPKPQLKLEILLYECALLRSQHELHQQEMIEAAIAISQQQYEAKVEQLLIRNFGFLPPHEKRRHRHYLGV